MVLCAFKKRDSNYKQMRNVEQFYNENFHLRLSQFEDAQDAQNYNL
jgi:hypothetical protein